jgi:hypothetical protein
MTYDRLSVTNDAQRTAPPANLPMEWPRKGAENTKGPQGGAIEPDRALLCLFVYYVFFRGHSFGPYGAPTANAKPRGRKAKK